MAKKYWLGTAPAVKQVSTVQITSVDATPANTTYTVTIGGVTISVSGNTDVNTTASDLQVALTASAHLYFTAVTWTVLTDTVTGTAAIAGVPFVAASSVSGGTGTIGAVTTTTASAGPTHFATAANWSGGVAPIAADDIIYADGSVNCCYDLNSSLDFASFTVRKTYTGKIGLPLNAFTTSADGNTNDAAKTEYRDRYLICGPAVLNLGVASTIGTPTGSSRIKIDNDRGSASVCTVFGTASSADGNKPAVQYKAAHANADVFVRDAPGGFGIAVDAPGETATVGDINVTADDTTTLVEIGEGVTLTNFIQNGGTNFLKAAATITKVEVNDGELTTEGDYTVTTLESNGGTVLCNHIKTAAAAVTTLNMEGGEVDFLGNNEARTITTLNPNKGTIRMDNAFITVTTHNQPSGPRAMAIT